MHNIKSRNASNFTTRLQLAGDDNIQSYFIGLDGRHDFSDALGLVLNMEYRHHPAGGKNPRDVWQRYGGGKPPVVVCRCRNHP